MTTVTESEVLRRVAGEVFEGAAFVFSDELDATAAPKPGVWRADGVSLAFKGPRSGGIRLWAEESLGRIVAANMLGLDATDPSIGGRRTEALKELLNIVVGRFITTAFGDDRIFDLGLPATVDFAILKDDMESRNRAWLSAEGTPVLLVLNTDEPAR
jgi:hypothetical protein